MAAYQAGEFLLDNLDGVREIHYKGRGQANPFSQVDEEAEDIILGIISDAFPEHSFISEERGKKERSSDYTWIIGVAILVGCFAVIGFFFFKMRKQKLKSTEQVLREKSKKFQEKMRPRMVQREVQGNIGRS